MYVLHAHARCHLRWFWLQSDHDDCWCGVCDAGRSVWQRGAWRKKGSRHSAGSLLGYFCTTTWSRLAYSNEVLRHNLHNTYAYQRSLMTLMHHPNNQSVRAALIGHCMIRTTQHTRQKRVAVRNNLITRRGFSRIPYQLPGFVSLELPLSASDFPFICFEDFQTLEVRRDMWYAMPQAHRLMPITVRRQ